MDKKTEALKLALEASEVLEALFNQAEAMHEDMTAGVNVHCQITVADLSKGLYAAHAIREALADPDYKALYEKSAQQYNELAALMAEQPAQQRPQNCGTGYCSCIECLFEQPAQQQEPVAYSYTSRITGAQGFSHHPMPRFIDAESWDIKPLYTTPPQRKPLTDEQLQEIADKCRLYPRDFARAIEAAHGIKGDA